MENGQKRTNVQGTIYLLHFDRPFKHARHYLGFAEEGNLEQRLAEHGTAAGSRLLYHVRQAGISWTLTRTWTGTRNDERALKKIGGAARHCPDCGVRPSNGAHGSRRRKYGREDRESV